MSIWLNFNGKTGNVLVPLKNFRWPRIFESHHHWRKNVASEMIITRHKLWSSTAWSFLALYVVMTREGWDFSTVFDAFGIFTWTGVGCGARGALAVYHVIPLFAVTDTNLTGRGEGVRILPSHYDHIKQQHQRCLFPSLSLNFVTAIAGGGGGNWNDHFEFEILIGIGGRSPNQPHLYSNQNWSQNKHFVALFSMLGHLPKVTSL